MNSSSRIMQAFLNNIDSLFDNSRYSDIKIIIDYKESNLQKSILSSNKKFREVFASDPNLKEIFISDKISDSVEHDIKYLFSHDLDQEEMEVLNFTFQACETFLQYLYNPSKMKEEKVNLNLILVAHEFADENLKEFCEDHLIKNINMKNAVRTLLVSLKTGCKRLESKACEIVAKNYCEMKLKLDFKLVLENDAALFAVLNVLGEQTLKLKTFESEILLQMFYQILSFTFFRKLQYIPTRRIKKRRR